MITAHSAPARRCTDRACRDLDRGRRRTSGRSLGHMCGRLAHTRALDVEDHVGFTAIITYSDFGHDSPRAP